MKLESLAARVAQKVFAKPQTSSGQCLCGKVQFEIETPARWAWHDHSHASRVAHGAAYATYVGSWRKRLRVVAGASTVKRFADLQTATTRSFCGSCGTPLFYERAHSPHMVNIPRALFAERTGREPRYHVAIVERRDWAFTDAPLVPLPGFPGIVWERPKSRTKKRTSAWQTTSRDASHDDDGASPNHDDDGGPRRSQGRA